MLKKLQILLLLLAWSLLASAQNQPLVQFKGKILSQEEKVPLPGALITVGENQKIGISDENGSFAIEITPGTYPVKITYLGMKVVNQTLTIPMESDWVVFLEADPTSLQEVTVMYFQ